MEQLKDYLQSSGALQQTIDLPQKNPKCLPILHLHFIQGAFMNKPFCLSLSIILFFFIIICTAYAEDTKSITIRHIGEQDAQFGLLIINTTRQGPELNQDTGLFRELFSYYYLVQESTFEEIINLITNNEELFGEPRWGYSFIPEYSSFSFLLFPDEFGNLEVPIELMELTKSRDRRRISEFPVRSGETMVFIPDEYGNYVVPEPYYATIELVLLAGAYGTFELNIKNEGEERKLYLVERRTAALFYKRLIELLEIEMDNDVLLRTLNGRFEFLGFNQINLDF